MCIIQCKTINFAFYIIRFTFCLFCSCLMVFLSLSLDYVLPSPVYQKDRQDGYDGVAIVVTNIYNVVHIMLSKPFCFY